MPQCLLKCWRLAVQLAHGSSGEPVRMSHPCVAFSRRTRLNTRFRELGSGSVSDYRSVRDMAVRHIQSVMPATYPYSSSLIIRPQIRGFTLCRIPGGLHPLLTEGGPPMMRANSGVADKAIDRILELSVDAHIRRRGTVRDSMKPKSISDWYRILRVHYRFSRIQSIRFALWLHAGV